MYSFPQIVLRRIMSPVSFLCMFQKYFTYLWENSYISPPPSLLYKLKHTVYTPFSALLLFLNYTS